MNHYVSFVKAKELVRLWHPALCHSLFVYKHFIFYRSVYSVFLPS